MTWNKTREGILRREDCTMEKEQREKSKWLKRFILLSLLSVPATIFPGGTTWGASAVFPNKEITIIVNFGPGGARDIIARGVSNTMSKYLGVPVVVMNTPGAGGARGMINLYNAAPDGYTIGVGAGTDVIDQILEKRDYDNKKFTYIGNAQHSPGILFVKSDSPFRSIKDFKTFGKTVRYSTFSLTSNSTIVSMILANREGFPLAIVGGYQSAAAATLGLIRGEVEFSAPQQSTATPFIKAAQVRPILTIDRKRNPDFPDIQTVGEAGHPDLDGFALDFWFMAPPGVPRDRAQILETALMKTLKDPEFLTWAKGAGVDPGPMNGDDLQKMVLRFFGLIEQYKGEILKFVKK